MQNNIVRLICQRFTPSGFLSSGANFKGSEYFNQIDCLSMIKTHELKEMEDTFSITCRYIPFISLVPNSLLKRQVTRDDLSVKTMKSNVDISTYLSCEISSEISTKIYYHT